MYFAINGIMIAMALVLGVLPLVLTARLKNRLQDLADESDVAFAPPATVVLPCKGLDPGFAQNIEALLAQDHPVLQLLFVVEAEDDPAFAELGQLLTRATPRVGMSFQLIVAGTSSKRAQKLTNQLAGVAQAASESRILVFVDSDCRPDTGFVRRLVQPLADTNVGASTGYRWYLPPKPTLGSMLRSTWNAGGLPFLVDPKRVFAWGGAMAIRRETFESAAIAEAWDRAVSDDMTLTVAIRRRGLALRFVPRCIAVSYESSSVAETLEFTNRQSLISKVYFPPLWWGAAIGHGMANILVLYGLASLIIWAHTNSGAALAGGACVLLLPIQLANAAWMFDSAKVLLPHPVRTQLERLRWHYVFTAPLASVMTLVNTVHAATTRHMEWRGIHYELRSPTETIVTRG